MKDELPDLTPYLNKKGGNSQGRGDEPAGKTDISQKLSALVKKPGTSTGSHSTILPSVPAASGNQASNAAPAPAPASSPSPDMSAPSHNAAPVEPPHPEMHESPIGIVRPQPQVDLDEEDEQSPIGLVRRAAPLEEAQSPIGIVKPKPPVEGTSQSSIGIVRPGNPAADKEIPNGRTSAGSNGKVQQPSSRWGDLSNFGETSHLDNTLVRNPNQSEKAIVIDAAARVDDLDAPLTVQRSDDNYAPPSNRETGRPPIGQPIDKLKGPQAKPMSTLSSSSAPPLLKTPSKQPGRPAQPYSYKPAIEPGREAMAPKAPSPAPVNRAPQPVATPKPQVSNTNIPAAPAKAPAAPLSSPASSFSSPSPSSSSSSSTTPANPVSSSPSSSSPSQPPSSYSSEPVNPPRPQPARVETEAEKLARAFMEEARALQEESRQETSSGNFSDDYFSDSVQEAHLEPQSNFASETLSENFAENHSADDSSTPYDDFGRSPAVDSQPDAKIAQPPDFYASQALAESGETAPHEPGPRASLSNLFDSGVYNSRYQDQVPKKTVGFGNLLAGAQTSEDDDNKHSTFADLMVPTGEHDALLAPDRREPSATSAFDEIAAQIDAEEEAVRRSLSGDSLSSPVESSYQPEESSQTPAFSSLFSNEIVTSGSDFSNRFARPDSHAEIPGSSVLPESNDMQTEEEGLALSPKSIAINKLIEAVNQSESLENKGEDYSYNSSGITSDNSSAGTTDNTGDFSFAAPTGDGAGLFSSEIVGSAPSPISTPLSDFSESESLVASTTAAEANIAAAIPTPDPSSLSATALEALAAFVPNAGEEQHETKGLLAKLKAKDAAVKAAQKAAAAKAAEKTANEAQSFAKAEMQSDASENVAPPVESKPAEVKPIASLASLLAQTQAEPAEIKDVPAPAPAFEAAEIKAPDFKPAQAKVTEAKASDVAPAAAEDEDSGNSLGDAISDALDKLLGEKADSGAVASASTAATEPPSNFAAPEPSKQDFSQDNDITTPPAAFPVSGGLSKLLDDDPDRFNRPINSNLRDADDALQSAVAASVEEPPAVSSYQAPAEDAHALTLTNSKVDALSRLLEVASKAPEKSSDDKKKAAESSHKLAEMINKAPGKVSRQNETLDPPDYMQQQNSPAKESFTSPFGGGTSPFSSPGNSYTGPAASPTPTGSPFGTPVNSTNSGVSLNHTPAGGFSATGQSQQIPGSFSGTGSMSDMPKASGIGGDAVSARIAALNRKLEEQTKGPGASATVSALASSGSLQAPPPELPPLPPQPQNQPAADFVPNPIVDDSPQTRAELVNRIIGSAKINQPAAATSPTRSMQELPVDQALAQMRSQKEAKTPKSPPKSKARSRGANPGFDPKTLLLVVAVVCIAGLGGVLAVQNGVFKNFDLSKLSAPDFGKNKSGESKVTIEQLIKSGDLDKAREMLEAKKESGKFSSSDGEKLYSIYYQLADKAISNGDDPAEATKLLEKIPSKTKKFKDAQKLLRKLKKKAKKN